MFSEEEKIKLFFIHKGDQVITLINSVLETEYMFENIKAYIDDNNPCMFVNDFVVLKINFSKDENEEENKRFEELKVEIMQNVTDKF